MNYMILVDPQNEFFSGKFKNEEALRILPNICKAIENHNGPIIATKDSHTGSKYEKSVELNTFGDHCIIDTWGWNFPEDVQNSLNLQGHYYGWIAKNSFGSMDLVNTIKDAEKLFLTHGGSDAPSFTIIGLDTDICVVSNALILRSAFPESVITVYSDCCAGSTPENHLAALAVMRSCCIDVKQLF